MESKVVETTAADVLAVVSTQRRRSRWLWMAPGVILAALWSAAIVWPAYSVRPVPGSERDMAANILPSPPGMQLYYPWLPMMDRRLIVFGLLTVFCKLLAQLLFPAFVTASAARAARQEQAAANSFAVQIKAIWRPWALFTVGLLLVGAVGNLVAIKMGRAPSFPAYPRKITFGEDLAMALPALVAIPLSGLLIAALSAVVGKLLKQPTPAVLVSYVVVWLVDNFIGSVARDMPMTLHEFLPPPGLEAWSVGAALALWVSYGLVCGFGALLLWYFATPSAGKGKTPAPAE
jgi:hypothetical protein